MKETTSMPTLLLISALAVHAGAGGSLDRRLSREARAPGLFGDAHARGRPRLVQHRPGAHARRGGGVPLRRLAATGSASPTARACASRCPDVLFEKLLKGPSFQARRCPFAVQAAPACKLQEWGRNEGKEEHMKSMHVCSACSCIAACTLLNCC